MVIRFLRDFRSAATNEVFYAAGQTADVDRAGEVVAEGAAVFVPIDARVGQVQPKAPEAKPTEKPQPIRPKGRS